MNNNHTSNIADHSDVINRIRNLNRKSNDVKSRLAPVLKKLWDPQRKFQAISNNIDFIELRDNFPQFEEVINFYEITAKALGKLNAPFEITPVLLQGEPGLGKTFFVSELARAMGFPFYEVSLATTTGSFTLSGGSTQWAEGSPGFICNTLAESDIINPFVLIDEIDKCSGSHHYDPLNVFYNLLESHTAKRFRDEALEINIDASKIIWIATSNYLENIPEPIKSRMRVFKITQPHPQVMEDVVRKIYAYLMRTKPYGSLLQSELENSVVEKLSNHSPRSIKHAIEEGSYKAIRENRDAIRTSDLPETRSKYHVGFV